MTGVHRCPECGTCSIVGRVVQPPPSQPMATPRRFSPLFAHVAAVCGVSVADILSRSKTLSIARARRVAIHILSVDHRLSSVEIGLLLGRCHTTVLASLHRESGRTEVETLAARVRTAMLERGAA